jgi:hypothetical protein
VICASSCLVIPLLALLACFSTQKEDTTLNNIPATIDFSNFSNNELLQSPSFNLFFTAFNIIEFRLIIYHSIALELLYQKCIEVDSLKAEILTLFDVKVG